MKALGYSVLLFSLLLPAAIGAAPKPKVLFRSPDKPVPFYNLIVRRLQDKTVQFSDGRQFTIGKYLGKGSNSIVYALDDDWAIRLRLDSSERSQSFFGGYLDGYKLLRAGGVQTVLLDDRFGLEYAVVERLPDDMVTLDQFLKGKHGLPSDLLQIAEEALLQFAVSTFRFSEIDDIAYHHIVFNRRKKKWILIDWADFSNVPAHLIEDGGVFFRWDVKKKRALLRDDFWDLGIVRVRNIAAAVLAKRSSDPRFSGSVCTRVVRSVGSEIQVR